MIIYPINSTTVEELADGTRLRSKYYETNCYSTIEELDWNTLSMRTQNWQIFQVFPRKNLSILGPHSEKIIFFHKLTRFSETKNIFNWFDLQSKEHFLLSIFSIVLNTQWIKSTGFLFPSRYESIYYLVREPYTA